MLAYWTLVKKKVINIAHLSQYVSNFKSFKYIMLRAFSAFCYRLSLFREKFIPHKKSQLYWKNNEQLFVYDSFFRW